MRTIKEIYDSMLKEKESLATLNTLLPASSSYSSLLSELSSNSKVAVWRLFFFVVACAIFVHEGIVDAFKKEIEILAKNAIPGTLIWYRNKVLSFQYNHSLEFIDGKYQYNIIDTDALVVKHAAIIEAANGNLLVKVAKGERPNLEPLNASELASLLGFLNQIRFAGTKVFVSSNEPDSLKIYFDVYYSPILSFSTIKNDVENAVNVYIQNLPFNGILNISKLTDEVQKIDGVNDVVFNGGQSRYGDLPYQPIIRECQSNAGYFLIDTEFPLSSTINYIAS